MGETGPTQNHYLEGISCKTDVIFLDSAPSVGQLLHPSPHNKIKQHATSNKQRAGHRSKIFAGPGLKLWGWPYPTVPSLNPGFRLQAAPLLCAAAAPTYAMEG